MPPTSDHERPFTITVAFDESHTVATFVIDAPADTTWQDVCTAAASRGAALPSRGYIGSEPVTPASRLGHFPLVSGAVLTTRIRGASDALVHLDAIEGPDCGVRIPVTRQPIMIGRVRSCPPRLRDIRLSREHFIAQVDAGAVTVQAVSHTNPVQLDGETAETATITDGHRLRAGASTYLLRTRILDGGSPRRRDEDFVIHPVNRPETLPPEVHITPPTRPPAEPSRRLPWPVIVLPVAIALLIAAVTRNHLFALFALLSPALMLASHFGDRGNARRRVSESEAAFETRSRAFTLDVAAALSAELRIRRALDPTVAECLRVARGAAPGLWGRPAGDVRWRIGIGEVLSRVDVAGRCARLQEAPVVVECRGGTLVGLVGPPQLTGELVASFVLQAATWHPPSAIRITFVTGERDLAEWALLLPHVTTVACIADALRRAGSHAESPTRSADPVGPAAISHLIILSPQDGRQPLPRVVPGDTLIVVLARTADDLPTGCAWTVVAAGDQTVTWSDQCGAHSIIPDLPTVDLRWAIARSIAPLRDAGESATLLPDAMALIDVFATSRGCDLTRRAHVEKLWGGPPHRPVALMGMTHRGPWEINLCAHGPHVLIGGTTGSGKSELLRTLIVSLAADQPPDRLSFVLIDYKGGSAFAECAQLPHTVGLVTDLDAALTRRALTCLDAELKRRERVLAAAGAADLDDLIRKGGTLSRLVLVVDEFRVLSEELPDFIAGLVRIATVGRSLGIHLVLATQRPAGVVSADIRANVGLRIALRVRDSGDSQDVVDCADAAHLPATSPGRAIVRSAGSDPVTVQCALSGAVSSARRPIRVTPLGRDTGSADNAPDSVLPDIVASLQDAAAELSIPQQPSPWPAPLPTSAGVIDLTTVQEARSFTGRPTAVGAAIALLDRPDAQRVSALAWDPPADGHLAICGGPRSGRTTALRATLHRLDPTAECYVFDLSGRLTDLETNPQVAAVASRDEPARVKQILDLLESRARPEPADSTRGITALLIDGWDGFIEMSDDATGGMLADQLNRIMRDAVAARVVVAATGGRALLSGRGAGAFTSRLTLRMSDATELLLAGVPAGAFGPKTPPGRGVLLPGDLAIQVIDGIEARAGGRPAAVRLSRLPDLVRPEDASGLGVALSGNPVRWPTDRGRLLGLVAGRAGSGRSNALRVLARTAEVPTAWVGFDQASVPGVPFYPPEDLTKLADWCARNPRGVILVDDLDRMSSAPLDDLLDRHLTGPGSVIGSGEPDALATKFGGVVATLRRCGTGLALMPARRSDELFGVRLGLLDRPRPGRGFMVHRGSAAAVQITRIDPGPSS